MRCKMCKMCKFWSERNGLCKTTREWPQNVGLFCIFCTFCTKRHAQEVWCFVHAHFELFCNKNKCKMCKKCVRMERALSNVKYVHNFLEYFSFYLFCIRLVITFCVRFSVRILGCFSFWLKRCHWRCWW